MFTNGKLFTLQITISFYRVITSVWYFNIKYVKFKSNIKLLWVVYNERFYCNFSNLPDVWNMDFKYLCPVIHPVLQF